jgi:hypothetical protein
MAAVNFLYYCTVDDIEDHLVNLKQSFGDTNNLNFKRRRRFISHIYGEINAALSQGKYQVPVTNSSKATTNALTASNDNVAITASDGSLFAAGNTVRVHGTSSNQHKDEFVGVVLVSSNTVTVEFLENSYDNGSTIELCTSATIYLRRVNAIGAALLGIGGLAIGQGRSRNEKLADLQDQYNACLKEIREGTLNLAGLTVQTASDLIDSYQAANSNDTDVAPVIKVDMEF